MTAKWNVRDENGTLVESLDRLATVLRTSPEVAAKALLSDPVFADAAPVPLRTEAKARQKGGGDKPPTIGNGSFVSWSNGKGRVDLIVSNGKVPGVSEDVEGTEKSPAARVVVYEDGKATGKKYGASTHTLRRIAPITTDGKKSDGPDALVTMLSEHEAKCADMDLPSYSHVTGFAVKAVYDRGLSSWPGESKTTLSPQQWAIGRVEHFVKAAAGDVAPKAAGHDVDLLAPEHPLHKAALQRATPPPNTTPVPAPAGAPGKDAPAAVVLDMSEVDQQIKSLLDGL